MRLLLVAAAMVVLAGLALGASLNGAARVAPVSVSLSAPGAPVPLVKAPAAKPAAVAAANAIARGAGQQAEVAAPVIPVPPLARPAANPTPQVQQSSPPAPCHGEHKHCQAPNQQLGGLASALSQLLV